MPVQDRFAAYSKKKCFQLLKQNAQHIFTTTWTPFWRYVLTSNWPRAHWAHCLAVHCNDTGTLCKKAEMFFENGEPRGMYEGFKQTKCPSAKKTALLKSLKRHIIDRSKQMQWWMEHYHKLYSCETTVTEEALNVIPYYWIDLESLTNELEKAIISLVPRKAIRKNRIPAAILK